MADVLLSLKSQRNPCRWRKEERVLRGREEGERERAMIAGVKREGRELKTKREKETG